MPMETLRLNRLCGGALSSGLLYGGHGGAVLAACLLLGAFNGAAAGPAPVAGVSLEPHRAVYELGIARRSSGGAIVGARGRMVSEWRQTCEGWMVGQRVELRLNVAGGEQVASRSNYSSFESFDGTQFRFTSQTHHNNRLVEDFEGQAQLHAGGEGGHATYGRPAGLRFDLDRGSLFPTAHLTHLIHAARNGERQLSHVVFDGSDEQGPVEINAMILQSDPGRSAVPIRAVPGADGLLDGASWSLRLAFFSQASRDSEPRYELGLQMYENGVADHLDIDYGQFALSGRLSSLERIERPAAC